MSKYLIALLIVVTFLFLLGFFVGIKYAETKVKSSIESSLILEKIKDVFKIATVEAIYHFLINQTTPAHMPACPRKARHTLQTSHCSAGWMRLLLR